MPAANWRRIGTADAVPALAALLADEKLAHMARYGLETDSRPAVDVALREALGKLKGLPLVGVIGSIGVRRDEKAVAALVALLKDPDAEVAQAAARALGMIGTRRRSERPRRRPARRARRQPTGALRRPLPLRRSARRQGPIRQGHRHL